MNHTDDEYLNLADVHSLLGNQRRIYIIGYLSLFNPGRTVEVRHLARVVRGIETKTPPTQVGTKDYESAYNGLIQTHLPKLDERGLVEYDDRGKTVTVNSRIVQYGLLTTISRFVVSVDPFA
jgi:hypothetical protein